MKNLLLAVAVLLVAPSSDQAHLETRVFPQMSLTGPTGCSSIIMTAEIKGLEDERFYCPKVTWEFPDGTRAVEESDCPPYEQRDQCYPPPGPECGLRGWYRNPITGEIVDKVKECPCTVFGYQRIWRRRLCAPGHPQGEAWLVWVLLEKNGKTITRQEIRFWVKE
jgi:hypothetical protein